MPLRFRRTLRIGRNAKLNFSKSGVSTTVGPKGFHFTFGKRGIRRSIGIPGTGISEVDYIKKNGSESEKEKEEKKEERREAGQEHSHARASRGSGSSEARTRHGRGSAAAVATGSSELRNLFVLMGVVVFFFAGAAVLGLMPAHFLSNSLQYLTHLLQSTGR